MKNTVSTKKSSSIFLAIGLVAGTIVLSSPSFMIGNVHAQRDYGMDSYDNKPYENSYESDYGNDNRYDSYEPEYTDNAYNSYEPEYTDNAYNSYEPEYTTMHTIAMNQNTQTMHTIAMSKIMEWIRNTLTMNQIMEWTMTKSLKYSQLTK